MRCSGLVCTGDLAAGSGTSNGQSRTLQNWPTVYGRVRGLLLRGTVRCGCRLLLRNTCYFRFVIRLHVSLHVQTLLRFAALFLACDLGLSVICGGRTWDGCYTLTTRSLARAAMKGLREPAKRRSPPASSRPGEPEGGTWNTELGESTGFGGAGEAA